MVREKEFPVYGENGFRGTLLSAARFLDASPEKRVRLEDGREIKVPSSALVAQPDGSYYLQTAPPGVSETPAAPPPRVNDTVTAPSNPEAPAPPPARAREALLRQPSEPESRPARAAPEPEPRRVMAASASDALFREDCDVERVPVKRILERPAEIRQDGDTLIIPLMEEVLVVEKRLMLREELHVKRRREHKPDSDRAPIPAEELTR